MDIIFLREIRLDARIGIYKREKTITQTVELDLDWRCPTTACSRAARLPIPSTTPW